MIDIFRYIPKRLLRIVRHVGAKFHRLFHHPKHLIDFRDHLFWLLELLFYVFDLFGLGEIYETLSDVVKFNTRPLNDKEIAFAREIFGDRLHISRIRIDEYAFLGPKMHHFAYVSFCTINSWGSLSEATFIHELVHIWQYQKLGSVYIPRALSAQLSDEGYDYGGIANLVKAVENGRRLKDFNLEQQGDIIADYYRIKRGGVPRWGISDQEDLWVFEELLNDVNPQDEAVAA